MSEPTASNWNWTDGADGEWPVPDPVTQPTVSVDEETLLRLAVMPLLEYERVRATEAAKLGCRVSTLDRLLAARRITTADESSLQGRIVNLPDVELWPGRVAGAELLSAVAEVFKLYIDLPDCAENALALWAAHAHAFKAFEHSPRLNIKSPVKQCGKTTLRDVIATLVPRPVSTENLTTAVLFRVIEKHEPTVLADECDTWITENEELRGLLNSGHKRGGQAWRCEGDKNEVRAFAVFSPVVLCGIGALPGTLHDRAIVIRLERAKPGGIAVRFDSRNIGYEQELCRKLARFAADNLERLEMCDPKLPECAFNRLADNWRPLFAIAEIAGGDWPKCAAEVFGKLTDREDMDAQGIGVMLLADIKQVFTVDRIFSKDLIELLAQFKERPWLEVCRGKPITERWLARKLAAFGIRPKLLRIDDADPARGYENKDFSEAYARYLPREGGF